MPNTFLFNATTFGPPRNITQVSADDDVPVKTHTSRKIIKLINIMLMRINIYTLIHITHDRRYYFGKCYTYTCV